MYSTIARYRIWVEIVSQPGFVRYLREIVRGIALFATVLGVDTLGMRIKLARETRRMTAEQLAAAVGVDISTVFRWEAGDSKPRPATLGKIAEATKFPLGHFTIARVAETPPDTPWPGNKTDRLQQKVNKMEREIEDLKSLIRERLSGPGDWRLKNTPPRGQREDLGQSVFRLRQAS